MASTEAGLRHRESAADVRRDQSRQRRVFAWTETRRAFMTTEFWIAIAMAAAVIIAAYKNDGVNLGIDQAWALGSGIIALYVLSRGIAKAGSSDPDVRDIDRS
jgi:hypothetical protein